MSGVSVHKSLCISRELGWGLCDLVCDVRLCLCSGRALTQPWRAACFVRTTLRGRAGNLPVYVTRATTGCICNHWRNPAPFRMTYRSSYINRSLRHVALSISFLSPMARRPDAFFAMNIASLILRPDLRFLALTSFQSLNRPNLSLGSSSRISRPQAIFWRFAPTPTTSRKHP
jgi:hypothetical protein